jgi:type II secretory pathway pseudopilin PulG
MIEIAVVLLVMSILAACVVPQILNYARTYRLGVASRNLATALQRARFLATSNNTRAGISILDVGQIRIEQYEQDGTGEPAEKGRVVLPEGITISADAPRELAFDGRGVLTPLPLRSPSIRVNGFRGYYMIVTVSATGQVTLSGALSDGESRDG